MLAATNRPDVLDPALLRPGRFDRRVVGQPAGPGRPPRRSSRCTPAPSRSPPDVDLAALAATTPGMVGADLRNLVNEAALHRRPARPRPGHHGRLHRRAGEDRPRHPAQDHDDAGGAAADRATTRAATRCSACSPPAPTRCARSRSSRAGTRSASPSRARTPTSTPTPSDVPARPHRRCARRPGRRGGRLRRHQHRRRVRPRPGQPRSPGRWSAAGACPPRIGPVAVLPRRRAAAAVPGLDGAGPAPATRELVDAEVRRIVDECYERGRPGAAATTGTGWTGWPQALLEHETLDSEAAYAAAGVPRTARPDLRPGELPTPAP